MPIWGTSPEAIDLAEDRKRFGALLVAEGIRQPENGTATTLEEALAVARELGFPVLVRPRYVLGGRAMAVCYDEESLAHFMTHAAEVSEGHPVLLDRFLEDAVEFDLDLVADGRDARWSAASCSTSRRPGSTPATRPRCCRRTPRRRPSSTRCATSRSAWRCGSACAG